MILLNRQEFKECMEFIKERKDMEHTLNKIFTKEFENSIFYPYSRYETKYIKLLQKIMDDNEDNSIIEYFIYECDFGNTHFENPNIIDKTNNKEWYINSIDALYDYLEYYQKKEV